MLRFKHFAGSGPELEQAINSWLGQVEPDVTHMVQTVGKGESLLISLLFEESFRGQELRLSEERGMASAVIPAIPPEMMPDEPLQVTEQ